MLKLTSCNELDVVCSFACLCEFEYGEPSFSVAPMCMYGRSRVPSCLVVIGGSSSWFTNLFKCFAFLCSSTSHMHACVLETLVCPCWRSAIAYICPPSSCRSPSWSRSSKFSQRYRAPISDLRRPSLQRRSQARSHPRRAIQPKECNLRHVVKIFLYRWHSPSHLTAWLGNT